MSHWNQLYVCDSNHGLKEYRNRPGLVTQQLCANRYKTIRSQHLNILFVSTKTCLFVGYFHLHTFASLCLSTTLFCCLFVVVFVVVFVVSLFMILFSSLEICRPGMSFSMNPCLLIIFTQRRKSLIIPERPR